MEPECLWFDHRSCAGLNKPLTHLPELSISFRTVSSRFEGLRKQRSRPRAASLENPQQSSMEDAFDAVWTKVHNISHKSKSLQGMGACLRVWANYPTHDTSNKLQPQEVGKPPKTNPTSLAESRKTKNVLLHEEPLFPRNKFQE